MKSEALNKKISSISAFDLDHTLFAANGSYHFGRYLCSKKLLPLRSLAFIIGCNVRHTAGFLPITQLHQKAFDHLFKGRPSAVVKQWALDFLHDHFDDLLYSPAVEKLKSAQQAGHLTAILSSSPDFLVGPVAEKLNVPFWNATQYAVDKDHKFCHIASLMLGHDKAIILDQLGQHYGVPKEELYAYSDSHLDLPFLMTAGTAYGVNPNKKLRSICRQKSWSII